MKLLILDRDGVINEDSDNYIKTAEEWLPIPGSIDAMAKLSRAGYSIYIATNQSGLGRGLFNQGDLDAMHDKLKELLLDAGGKLCGIYYCPHSPDCHCDCRKPAPGLLQQIARDSGHSLRNVPLVGDSLRDLQAGQAMGCKLILVTTGKGGETLRRLRATNDPIMAHLAVFDSLSEVADALTDPGPPSSPEPISC